jgi:hypothetical protein
MYVNAKMIPDEIKTVRGGGIKELGGGVEYHIFDTL